MPRRELLPRCRELSELVWALCRETAGHDTLKEQLLLAVANMERHLMEASGTRMDPDAIDSLKEAVRDCREAAYWLSALARNGVLPREGVKKPETLCVLLQRHIGGSLRDREASLAARHETLRPDVSLTTSRLTLLTFCGRHEKSLYSLLADPAMGEIGCYAPTREEALGRLHQWERQEDVLAVERRRSDGLVGIVTLTADPRNAARRYLACGIREENRLSGYGTEAVQGTLTYGFAKLGMTVATALLPEDNTGMRRILSYWGFREEGLLRRASPDGRDLLSFSLLKEEWESQTP